MIPSREKEKIVQTIEVHLYCNKCDAEMLPDGRCLMSSPPQYPHVCSECHNTINISGKRYPYIRYEEIDRE